MWSNETITLELYGHKISLNIYNVNIKEDKCVKKIIMVAAVMCAMTITASAGDLTFTPEGGGKWIFCNNPEGIRNCDLMNDSENPSTYIMNNENLEPDLYDFLICHINTTDTDGGYGVGQNIEVDIEITAVEDSEITINKAFFETPTDSAFIFGDGTWAKEMHKVGCLNGFASFLGVDLAERNGAWLYEAQDYEPVTINLKKGETVWLSDYMDDYKMVCPNKPVQIMGEVELTEGMMNFNVAAFRSGEEVGDRSSFNPEADFGEYAYTRTQKGIADSLPKVNVELEYKIDNTVKDGDYFENKVFNQYKPDGYVTDAWCSHLNPQDDIWSKDIAVENDLLTMYYKDDTKLDYYGSKVKDSLKNNIWTFDPFHSDTTSYQGTATWFNAEDYMPNYDLSVNRSNQGYGCSMGNYCVTESYNLKVSNVTNRDRYFEYEAETISNIAVYVEDENGKHSGLLKGETSAAERNVLASVKIPANSEKEFTVNVVLPINYVGGIKNRFKVSEKSSIDKYYEDFLSEPRAQEGPITTGVLAEEVKDKLPQSVKDIIRGNYNCYELVETDDGYMMRWLEWDGSPYYYTAQWDRVKTIYYLDKNYNIVDKYVPEIITRLALYYDGYYYIENAEGNRFKSADGQNWESYNHRMPLPEISFNNSVPSKWAESEVERAYIIDIVPYEFLNKLSYKYDMKRETFCDILASMLELKDMLPPEGEGHFSDTDNTNVLKLCGAKIINGYDDGTFRPDGSITRQEAAAMLYRTAKYLGYKDKEISPDRVFSDDASIAEWAKDAVYQMNLSNIMFGFGGGMFAPENNYTNEQSIATVLRLYDAV